MNNHFPLPTSLADGHRFLALEVPAARRKQLGQCFTGLQTGRLLAALAMRSGQKRIVDPMAGHGDLIESAAVRATHLGLSALELLGVEIEPEAARLCKWRIKQCINEFGIAGGRLVHGDAFAPNTWESESKFDLVITNPPYVRYQTFSNGGKDGKVKLLNAGETRRALEQLAMKLAPPEERHIWQWIIRSYSGFSDLSIPSWLLCGLLTASNGVLALVVPQTWLNRNYARIARYFFLRFFQPLAIVQESGQRWFQDAQVPVSLIVGRRLLPNIAAIPLHERSDLSQITPFVEIDHTAASSCSHVGKAFTGDDPEGAFACWLDSGNGSRQGVKLKRISWESQRDEVLAASRGCDWLRQLEGKPSIKFSATSPSSVLPASVAYHLPVEYLRNLRPLASEPVRIGQGLRTGCNPFFYVELVDDTALDGCVYVLTHELFGRRQIAIPTSALKPVLRRQTELSTVRIITDALRGRLLDLREFVLPEDVPKNSAARSSKWKVMPEALAEYVRLAARTYLVRGETRTLIPQLSAVRPNGRGPNERRQSSLLHEDVVTRMWYMIPDFTSRHLAHLCVPRIIHDEPRAILNSVSPVLLDANFSTIWGEGRDWSPDLVFAILNSTWGELCMESLGATLGGGALKLEATHLRQLPLPTFSETQREEIRCLVREVIDASFTTVDHDRSRVKIDQVIVSALAERKLSEVEAKTSVKKLAKLVLELRSKRRQKPKVQPQETE